MKLRWILLLIPAAALAAGAALAGPLKVRPLGGDSQIVLMCPDCSQPIACARAGDYTIGFSAETISPKSGIARLIVRLNDAAGKAVNNAKVAVHLTMPEHNHRVKKPIQLKRERNGKYTGITSRLLMTGAWEAEVAVTTPKGDVVKQKFGFTLTR